MHELHAELAARGVSRTGLAERWLAEVGDPRAPLAARLIAAAPPVMSERLHAEVGERLRALVGWLADQVGAGRWAHDERWPGVDRPDVLTADIAIVEDRDAPGGWSLRWVEFQAFHSVAASVHGLHRAWSGFHAPLGDLMTHEVPAEYPSWEAAMADWLQTARPGAVLLEQSPASQTTAFDLFATSRVLGLPIVQPEQLRLVAGALQHSAEPGSWTDVRSILNRLILVQAAANDPTREMLARARVGWRGHPAWFERIHKGLLAELPADDAQRCARADRWRELGRPAGELVLKSTLSWGGQAVRLHVTADELDALPDARHWIVQPRYAPFPLARARDGAPLYGELRTIVALPPGKKPWVAARLARMSRGPMSNAGTWTGQPGEGFAPIYAPPGARPVFHG